MQLFRDGRFSRDRMFALPQPVSRVGGVVGNRGNGPIVVFEPWTSMSARLQAIVSSCCPDNTLAGVTSLRSIFWISIDRSAALIVNSFVASWAVLRFEPHTAMPPSNAATAAAIAPGSNLTAPKSIPVSTQAPPATIIRDAKINFRQLSIFSVSSSMRSSMRTISSCKLLLRSLSKFKLALCRRSESCGARRVALGNVTTALGVLILARRRSAKSGWEAGSFVPLRTPLDRWRRTHVSALSDYTTSGISPIEETSQNSPH
jgi:hypothetical protein